MFSSFVFSWLVSIARRILRSELGLHESKRDGQEFLVSGGTRHGDPIPDRVYVYRDGEAHFVGWAGINVLGVEDRRGAFWSY